MIAGLVGWLAGSRWALTAAKWGAVGITVLLFLLSVRRAGERRTHGSAPRHHGEGQ